MLPEQFAIREFVKRRDTHPVKVGRLVFGENIHGNFGQIEITTEASSGGDAGMT